MTGSKKTAIIIGAGPAGLTAASELLTRTDIHPIVVEKDAVLGGIARTVNYKGNRIDIGGHRFFSKSDRVMQWWLEMLPLQRIDDRELSVAYEGKTRRIAVDEEGRDPETTDEVMLVRPRKSRIYYSRKFFDYPVRLNRNTLLNLGPLRTARIGLSYLKAKLFPISDEENLEQFLINRFGKELYRTFFKSYTEKVWGVPCDQISAEWGAQRIKGLSVGKAIANAIARPFRKTDSVGQKGVETSLIERFLYPKFGPGQMWELCGRKILEGGGEIIRKAEGLRLLREGNRITALVATKDGTQTTLHGDYFISTMPIKELVQGLTPAAPDHLRQIGQGLMYRDFITVGLLLEGLEIFDKKSSENRFPSDTWIYIQEPDVRVGRVQFFNNWSPYLVADPSTVWIGLEYFCSDTDALWRQSDAELAALGIRELAKIGIIRASKVLDSTVIRMPKAYPAYFGTYDRFGELRDWLDQFENLFLIGRNGMHRYNNQDHSMLTAMAAVDAISSGAHHKQLIWAVNSEDDFHEEVARST